MGAIQTKLFLPFLFCLILNTLCGQEKRGLNVFPLQLSLKSLCTRLGALGLTPEAS